MIDHDLAVAKNAKENCLKFFLVIIYEFLKKSQLLIDSCKLCVPVLLKTFKIFLLDNSNLISCIILVPV